MQSKTACRVFTLLALTIAAAVPISVCAADAKAVEAASPALMPPPTITDLVMLLQSYAPDLARVERLKAELAQPVAETGNPSDLARAWHGKARVAEELAATEQWLAALNQALAYAEKAGGTPRPEIGNRQLILQDRVWAVRATQGFGAGIDATQQFIAEFKGQSPGMVINPLFILSYFYVSLGDLERAGNAITEAESLSGRMRGNVAANYTALRTAWLERARGNLFLAKGKHVEAERSFAAAQRQAEQAVKDNPTNLSAGRLSVSQQRTESIVDRARRELALVYLEQQRLDEAELLLREVLKSSLQRDGRNSRMVGLTLDSLSRVIRERGRYSEALVIADWAARTFVEAGFPTQSLERFDTGKLRATLIATVGRSAEAVKLFDELQQVALAETRHGSIMEAKTLEAVTAYLEVGRIPDGLSVSDKLLADFSRFYGPDHYNSAEARAYRAMALHRSNQSDEARREFERAITTLIDPSKASGKQQTAPARNERLRRILNAYLELLVGGKTTPTDKDKAEAFRIADVARWQSVQKAVTGSALRAATGNPELAARIKKVQDADDELEAVYKNLISQRSAPPDKQLPTVIAAMEARIAVLQKEQQSDLGQIRRQFPQYDALVNPRPADLATMRQALQGNEALLSIYVTPAGSYVWASAAAGKLHFHFSPRGTTWIAETVKNLRASVDFSSVTDFGRLGFDLAAAAALYQELLAPVQDAWSNADTLLVVANAALGQVPFSLLPTAAPGKTEPGLPLSQFRQVPWLVHKLAVAYLPSVSSLVTLRSLPPSKSQRDPFMGFGDPDFGAHAEAPSSSRGAGKRGARNLNTTHATRWQEGTALPALRSATPRLLPLPDTRDEIQAIATALNADMQNDLFFGAQANRKNVIAADLLHHRVLAFATHGLIAGDLPGLDQPALALAVEPGNSIYDGLFKLEDILKLSMDADLVVLSACNTAAADGSGAEAVSGLGRGFFYAGARAVLATHWPVESDSAKELVTHLFARYAQDGKLTRAQALRQSMLTMIDRGVALDSRGKPEFSYAHPAFWAPYALYGDPGR